MKEIEAAAKRLQERKQQNNTGDEVDVVKKIEMMLAKENKDAVLQAATLFLKENKPDLLK